MSQHGDRPAKSRKPYSRADHRARSHETAHTDAPLPPESTPDLPLVPKGHAPLLTTDAELAELIDHLPGRRDASRTTASSSAS